MKRKQVLNNKIYQDNTQELVHLHKLNSRQDIQYKNISLSFKKIRKKNIYEINMPINKEIFYFSKNARYKVGLPHKHNYIEMNYMYSGHCTQIINGNKIKIHQGELTIIDTNTIHTIGYCGKNDILVNFMLSKKFLIDNFISIYDQNNLLTKFFTNIFKENKNINFLVFDANKCERLSYFIFELIYEFYFPSKLHRQTLTCLFKLCFIEMAENMNRGLIFHHLSASDSAIVQALGFIDSHYLSCSSKDVAQYCHITPAYLTTLLKKETNNSCNELILKQKILHSQ